MFRFPFTPIIVAICRIKLYMSGIVCLATPGLIYSALYHNLDYQYFYNFGVCGFSVTTLILFGEFFRRCVGIVYINKDHTKVILLGLWGHINYVGSWYTVRLFKTPQYNSTFLLSKLGEVGTCNILGQT